LGVFILASCSKERGSSSNDTLSESEWISRSVDSAVEDLADEIVFRSDSDEVSLPACVEVTDSGPDVFPRLITLDFGDGCTDAMGRTRAGWMHITLSAPWEEVGSTRTVTFEDFTVTRPMQEVAIAVEGMRELERLEAGDAGESRWARSLNTTLTHEDVAINRVFNGIRRWIQGEEDPAVSNVFGLTGSGATTRDGLERTRTILEELIYDSGCGEIVTGVVEIDRPVLEDAVLDYGAGACDGLATLTVGGESFTIDL
jgi:hypothetical protein